MTFETNVPGWYAGRTPHVHFMIRTTDASGSLVNRLTSQVFLDQTFINSFYTAVSPYSTRGLPDTTDASDRVYNTTTTSGSIRRPAGSR